MKRFKATFHRDNGGIVVEPEEGLDVFGGLPKEFLTKWQIPSDKLKEQVVKPETVVKPEELKPPVVPEVPAVAGAKAGAVTPAVAKPAPSLTPVPPAVSPTNGKVEVKRETVNLMLGLLEYWGEMSVEEYFNIVKKQQDIQRPVFDKIVKWMVAENKAVVEAGKIKPKAG